MGAEITVPYGKYAGTKLSVDTLLREAYNGDITLMDRWLDAMADSADVLLQLFAAATNKAKSKVRMNCIDEFNKIYELRNKAERLGITNFEWMFEKDDEGNKADIATYQKALANDVKEQAKKISTKYLEPPMTTEFGIMFVPTESLYAEIIRIPGLSDEIRKKQKITIASPSTLPVMLNGLVMGFRTLAIEKRSADVWQTLGAVKTQFGKFGDLLDGVQKKLQESANKIESAKTTSRTIERKLRDVEELPETESVKLIGEV